MVTTPKMPRRAFIVIAILLAISCHTHVTPPATSNYLSRLPFAFHAVDITALFRFILPCCL